MRNYLDVGMGNYVVFDSEQLNIQNKKRKTLFKAIG
jgi:hypothetical protein